MCEYTSIMIIVQIHIQYRPVLLFHIRTSLLISGFGPWRHEERDTILKSLLTILCWPHPNTRHILWFLRSQYISTSRDLKNSTACLNGRKLNYNSQWQNLNWCLFKILKFSGLSLLGMTSSTLQPHFLSGSL